MIDTVYNALQKAKDLDGSCQEALKLLPRVDAWIENAFWRAMAPWLLVQLLDGTMGHQINITYS